MIFRVVFLGFSYIVELIRCYLLFELEWQVLEKVFSVIIFLGFKIFLGILYYQFEKFYFLEIFLGIDDYFGFVIFLFYREVIYGVWSILLIWWIMILG